MKMPFEWVVGDSSKGLHGDRAHVYDGGGAVTVNYTTLRGTTACSAVGADFLGFL